jgi:DNA-binding MarR family transcriptional regulator
MRYANDMPAPSRTALRSASLAAELRVALMHTSRRLRNERSSDDVTPGQYTVLAVLDRHGPLTPREIAAHEKVQPPSMTRTLAALEARGLVTRTDHPTDGRQVLMSRAEQGRREVVETRRRRDAWLARRLAALDPEEREVMARAAAILSKVVAE